MRPAEENPAGKAFVAAGAGRLAQRARMLAHPPTPAAPTASTHEPLDDLPTPPAGADLTATEEVLMAGIIGELRVVASALAVLERVTLSATKHEVADQKAAHEAARRDGV
ncbi:hypothetical protein [Gemmata massiliana]|nr:hypothetical protein [Gemmata massiliana]